MADMLTPQQQEAVDNRGGNLLVSAAAGSGKTKVLVDRVMKYIMDKNDPANVDDFLMITFTEAAAAELRGKIAAKLSEHIANDPSNAHLRHQMQRLYLAKLNQTNRGGERELLALMGTSSSFFAKKISIAAQKLSVEWLRNAMLLCAATDSELRDSNISDRQKAIELTLLEMSITRRN